MHYPGRVQCRRKDTIIPKKAGVVIGQREKLSDGDLKRCELINGA